MSRDKDDKTGVFKDLKTRIAEKSIQVQMVSGKIYGPYTRDEVLSFIENKKIRGEEKILIEGDTLWRPIASDPEFFDAIHAILSGNKIKRRGVSPQDSSPARDASDKTRASNPSSTQTEVLASGMPLEKSAFTESGMGDAAPPIWNPPVEAAPFSRPGTSAAPRPSVLTKPTSLKSTPKKKSQTKLLLIVGVAAVFVAVLVKSPQQGAPAADEKQFVAVTAPLYSRPLSLALRDLRVPTQDTLPEGLTKTKLETSFVYSMNARKIVERLNSNFDHRDQPEAKTSAHWAQRAIDLQLLGLRTQVVHLELGKRLIRQGKTLWEALEEKELLDAEDKKLLTLVLDHSVAVGDWDLVSKQAAQLSYPYSPWLDADAVWWGSWIQGVKRLIPSVGNKPMSAEMEITGKVRRAYFDEDPQMSTWLLQLASIEPETPYLWFVSAQNNWRKSRSVQVQNAYRDFIIGLGSLSLYPPSLQIAYWTQFADFLRSYARADTHKRALGNLAIMRAGNIGFRQDSPETWWDLGDEGLNAKDIADEILARSSKGMLNARDRAALEVLGSSLNEGSRYLFVVGTHLAFEGQWTDSLKVFDQIIQSEPKNADALFGKIWALAKLFRFSEAQDTYQDLVRSSVGVTTHLRTKGLIHFLGREAREAHRIFNDYLKQSPTDAWAHYFQAETFLSQDRFLDCIKSANLAKLHGRGELQFRAEQLFFRCRVKGGVGIRDSLDSIARLIKENPDNLPLRISYIDLLNETQLFEDAARVADDSLKYFPFSAKLRIATGALYDKQGIPGRALENYSQAAKLDPSLAEPWVRLAKVLERQDKFSEAAKNFEIAAKIQPTYPEIYLFAARAYAQASMLEDAAASFAKEIELRPSAVGTFVEAAEFLLKNNSPQKIPELYRRFQKGGFEEDPRALTRLAIAYNVMGDVENARNFASRAVAGNPDNPYANFVLADILDRAGDYNLAKRYYETYLKLMPLADDGPSLRERLSKPPYMN